VNRLNAIYQALLVGCQQRLQTNCAGGRCSLPRSNAGHSLPIFGMHRPALLFKQIQAPVEQDWKNAEMSRK
jgi:hypothetical protein